MAPQWPAHAEDRQDVIGVLHRLEVQEQRREAEHAQRRRREHRPLQAVRGALPQHPARRPRGAGEVIGHRVERALDPDGRRGALAARAALEP